MSRSELEKVNIWSTTGLTQVLHRLPSMQLLVFQLAVIVTHSECKLSLTSISATCDITIRVLNTGHQTLDLGD